MINGATNQEAEAENGDAKEESAPAEDWINQVMIKWVSNIQI